MSLQKLVKVFALAAAVVFSTGTARTAEPIVLKLSHFVPPQHAFHKWVVGWTQKIEQESGGPAEIHDLSERPTSRPAQPAVRRGAQRHHRHRLRACTA